MIHEIAVDLFSQPEVQSVFDDMKDVTHQEAQRTREKKLGPIQPIPFEQAGFDGAGKTAALALHQRGATPHAPHISEQGHHHPVQPGVMYLGGEGGSVDLRLEQGHAGRPGSGVLIESERERGQRYRNLSAQARRLEKADISNETVAGQALSILRGERPSDPAESQGTAKTIATLVGVEGGRTDRALVMMPELLGVVKAGRGMAHKEAVGDTTRLSLSEALTRANPVSPSRAVRGLHAIDTQTGGTTQRDYGQPVRKKDQAKHEKAKTHITEADINYFAHMVALKISGPDDLIGKSDADIKKLINRAEMIKELKTFIRQRTFKAHGLNRFP